MKIERFLAFILLIGLFLFGRFYLESDMLFFRLLAGVGLGYALSRGYTGFAGSVNRAYQTGSTRLMRTMTFMFFLTALFSVAVLFNADAKTFDLWVNPINLGLILGGLFFGFGMVFSSCCASGVLTDVVTAMPRGLITLLFFGAGVFVGFPLQESASWIKDSWVSTETGKELGGGVYFPDLFKGDGLQGYLGSVLLTAALCGIVIFLAYKYEQHRKKQNTYSGHFMENIQEKDRQKPEADTKEYKFWSEETYNRLFANPWSLMTAALVITGIFVILMGVTKAGWGASTPYGFWFGKFLMLFGVSPETLAAFTLKPEKPFIMPFFSHPINVQNFGIMMGTVLYLLSASVLGKTFRSAWNINVKQGVFYAIGGFLMGFGTRMSNGCNVGALYTPIANFSLSGWVFFIFLVAGGILGNMVAKKVKL